MGPDDTIIVTNYHMRLWPYETTVRMLMKEGYHFILSKTGTGAMTEVPPEIQRGVMCINGNHQMTYDQSMVTLRSFLDKIKWEYVFFLDNDCFLSDTKHLTALMGEFVDGGYDYMSNYVMLDNDRQQGDGPELIEPMEVQVQTSPDYPFVVPVPHFENAYMFIKRDAYLALEPEQCGHGRLMFCTMANNGVKFCVQKFEHRLNGFSHVFPEAFHCGNLAAFWYAFRSGDTSKFAADSELSKSRLGFMMWQADKYGAQIYHEIPTQAATMIQHGKEIGALDAWHRLIEGTCMEGWEVRHATT